MTHRPETIRTYELILKLRRGTRRRAPMKFTAIALLLNMTPDALKKMRQRLRRSNVHLLSPSRQK